MTAWGRLLLFARKAVRWDMGNGVTEGSGDVDRNWEMSLSRYGSLITHMAVGCHV